MAEISLDSGGCLSQEMQLQQRESCMREDNNKVYIFCVDYEKAFDRVYLTKYVMIRKNIAVDWKDRRLIWNLYQGQSTSMQIGNGLTAAC